MLGYFTEPVCAVLGMAYAPFMSFKAIQTPGGDDDKYWLTFWVVYSILITGPVTTFFLSFFPFYYEVKLAVLVWILFFGGAAKVYTIVLEPFFKKYERKFDDAVKDLPTAAMNAYKDLGGREGLQSLLTNAVGIATRYGPDVYSQLLALLLQQAKEAQAAVKSAAPTGKGA